jgi:P-type Cu+ transporter
MNSSDEKPNSPIRIERVRSSGPFVHHVDPVCGMVVESEGKIGAVEIADTRYLFCAKRCRDRFRQNPELFLDPEKRESRKPKNAVYICPMDPEVVEMEPIPCRICGMALEPSVPSASDGPDSDYLEMMAKFKVSALLSTPLLIVAMTEMFGLLDWLMAITSPIPNFIYWLQFALATPVVFWGGRPLLNRAVTSVGQLSPNMFTLIGLGVTVAHVFSTIVLLFPDITIWKDLAGGSHGLPIYFEAAAVIVTLALLGQILESKARRKTGEAVRELISLRPENATVILKNGDEVTVPVSDLEVGAVLRIAANEKIPTDGVVSEGTSQVDESMITGESVPVVKSFGDEVFGGTINGNRVLNVTVTRLGDETIIARIVTMVSEAQRSKAPVQKLADSVSRYFVPIVILISIATLIIWSFLDSPILGIVAAISVLIIACPCALGLATPMSIMVGSGIGARNGILLKSGEAIQNLSETRILALDKTGTLTLGKPKVVEVVTGGDFSESEILKLAAAVERNSEHPLASAIVNEADRLGLDSPRCDDFVSETAIGVSGRVDGKTIFVGRPTEGKGLSEDPRSAVEVRVDGLGVGMIYIEDEISESARSLIPRLSELDIETVMLTGDNHGVARAVSKALGIDRYHYGLLPANKAELVSELQSSRKKVAMVGDGVNDAPALATADVGIAIGSGTATAIETSDITLLSGRISDVVRAIRLSRNVMTNIRQNLFFAFAYNVVGIPIAAGLLYPWLGLLLSPMLASLAMTFSSVSVIANALRLRRSSF